MDKNLRQKLGQLFVASFDGYTLDKKIKDYLQELQPGGIVFFENNIKDKKQVQKLIKDINNILEIKPFLSVDQEGGAVERLRKVCTSTPSVWGLAKVGLKELLQSQEIIIKELKELGFNMNYSPVLDINSNPANPIIGTRAISNNPDIVSSYGAELIKLSLKHKVIPCAKHFPGHGDLNIDSHLALPTLNKTKEELNKFEFMPFRKAIQSKVPVVMISHIYVPKIEGKNIKPASLSKKMISLLRKELKFKGLIITDDLRMKAITKYYSPEDAALEAILEGVDLLLFNTEIKNIQKVFEYLLKKAETNKSFQKRINESYKRICTLKKNSLNLRTYTPTHLRTFAPLHLRTSTSMHPDKVIHWIKKDLFFTPLKKNEQITVMYPVTHRLRKEDLVNISKKLSLKNIKLFEYEINPKEEEINKILKKAKGTNKRRILITLDMAARKNQKKLVSSLFKIDPGLIVISCGLEYDIELAPYIKNFIAAYAPNYISLYAALKKLLKL